MKGVFECESVSICVHNLGTMERTEERLKDLVQLGRRINHKLKKNFLLVPKELCYVKYEGR